jgi:hypothetical protein
MAVLEFASRHTRAAAVSQAPSHPNRSTEVRRRQSWRENVLETGKTMLTLLLIALAIVALRYALVLAYGFFR